MQFSGSESQKSCDAATVRWPSSTFQYSNEEVPEQAAGSNFAGMSGEPLLSIYTTYSTYLQYNLSFLFAVGISGHKDREDKILALSLTWEPQEAEELYSTLPLVSRCYDMSSLMARIATNVNSPFTGLVRTMISSTMSNAKNVHQDGHTSHVWAI